MRPSLLSVLPFATLLSAWMPGIEKQILAQDGTDLFNETSDPGLRKRTLPSGKVRGVDLGSQFVFEPWIAESEWSTTGCAGQQSEFDCVSAVGQEPANSNFQAHWARWITQDDINLMKSYSLNTIRIPVGYWMKEVLTLPNLFFDRLIVCRTWCTLTASISPKEDSTLSRAFAAWLATLECM